MRSLPFLRRFPFLALTLNLALAVALRAQMSTQEAPVTEVSPPPAPPAGVTIPSVTGTAALSGTGADKWEKEIAAFEAKDKETPPPKDGVVFAGSSSLKLWKTLEADFPEIPVINRGFGGSKMPDLTRYADRIIIPYKPRLVVVYTGGNDINSKKTPAELMESVVALDEKLRAALPDTIIVHVTLNPTIKRLAQEPQVREFNKLLAHYATGKPKTVFIDTYSKMIGADGQPQEKLLKVDKLHPSEEGYKQFAAALKPGILKAYKDAGGVVK